ncbi:MAG: serine hydrolase [Halieaceae bacterium]|jgi:CubicO group peptidase (beta-lactamase class C family)|nr:serine hydrolase [Halieaceae bacterium]
MPKTWPNTRIAPAPLRPAPAYSAASVGLFFALLSPSIAAQDGYDYFADNRRLIDKGVQAVLSCNGLFTSSRSLEQVFEQELAYLGDRVLGSAEGGPYTVHAKEQAVSVGGGEHGETITAAFREGIGCVVMPPDAPLSMIDELPEIRSAADVDPPSIAWPMGDADALAEPDADVDRAALEAAAEWAFERDTPEQDTISLLVVHRGRIIFERYADGFDHLTRTRTWSTAKSIAATLIGMQVDAGRMELDAPLPFDWNPAMINADSDPRRKITLRHVLNMSSGLYPVDSFGMEYATGSGLAYWAGASSVEGMRDRGLVREPGTHWDYENYDTLLAVYALKLTLGSEAAYHAYPRTALLDRIGMRNTLLSTDRFGDFILSSQVYTNARDLARFGLLYLNNGLWQGERLISEEWVDFVRTPAPASAVRGHDYGGQFWLVPDDRKGEVPTDAYSTAGNRGQYVIIAPSHDLVIVRRGLDYGRQGFNRWDLLREVIKAIPEAIPQAIAETQR